MLVAGDTSHTGLLGASTLSQQVAKLLVTSGEGARIRKLSELLNAAAMEQKLGKLRRPRSAARSIYTLRQSKTKPS